MEEKKKSYDAGLGTLFLALAFGALILYDERLTAPLLWSAAACGFVVLFFTLCLLFVCPAVLIRRNESQRPRPTRCAIAALFILCVIAAGLVYSGNYAWLMPVIVFALSSFFTEWKVGVNGLYYKDLNEPEKEDATN